MALDRKIRKIVNGWIIDLLDEFDYSNIIDDINYEDEDGDGITDDQLSEINNYIRTTIVKIKNILNAE